MHAPDDDIATLPEPYSDWLKSALGGPIPRETVATCDNCVMLPSEDDAGLDTFDPKTRCCTYIPYLPNFRVGALLRDEDPELDRGRAEVRSRITRRVGVTPVGIARTAAEDHLYALGVSTFGNNPGLRCPHLEDDGRCGIWRYRNAVCSTYYCKHVRASVGAWFWHEVRDLLRHVEKVLSHHCVLEEEPSEAALRAIYPPGPAAPVAEGIDPQGQQRRYSTLWGTHEGQEVDYYVRSAARVEALDWEQIQLLGGPELRARLRVVRCDYASLLDRSLPAVARMRPYRVLHRDGSGGVIGAEKCEPVRAPQRLLEVLHRFDGQPLDEVRAQLLVERGLKVSDSLIRKLLDFGILVGDESA